VPGGSNKQRRKIESALLRVSGKGEGRTVLLEASILALRENPAHSAGRLVVAAYERYEAVRISRTASASIDSDSFAMSERGAIPETIEVELPAPFSGRALYSRSPDTTSSWTGNLGVRMPAIGMIPLTDSGFSAVFCRSSSIAKVGDCASHSGPRSPRRWFRTSHSKETRVELPKRPS
jgi:hypothetical protein